KYHITGQPALIDADSRGARRTGRPGMFRSTDGAPEGPYVPGTTIQDPCCSSAPGGSLAAADEMRAPAGRAGSGAARRAVRDGKGLVVVEQEPAPQRGQQPDSAAADAAAAAPDSAAGGERQERARRKDRVMHWMPPYDSASLTVLYGSENRMSSVRFSADASILFVTESSGGTTHEYAVFLSDPSKKYTITRTRTQSGGAWPADPDRVTLVTKRGPAGLPVVQLSSDQRYVFLQGTVYAE